MIQPTEHQELTHAEAEELAPGSIVASSNYVWLYVRVVVSRLENRWVCYGPEAPTASTVVTELPDEGDPYRLLRAAPVPLPAIGAVLTAAQLASLPPKATVVDEDGDAWQYMRGRWISTGDHMNLTHSRMADSRPRLVHLPRHP